MKVKDLHLGCHDQGILGEKKKLCHFNGVSLEHLQ